MKKFKVEVVMSYWQTIEIDAESQAEAEATALDAFDIKHALMGDGEINSVEEIEEEGEQMYAVVRDRNGVEQVRFNLSSTALLDPDIYAERYATICGFDIAKPDGRIPDGCEDFSVAITKDPANTAVVWSSCNYMIEE